MTGPDKTLPSPLDASNFSASNFGAARVLDATIPSLAAKYDALLFDAFGVLIDGSGALGGASKAIDYLKAIEKPYFLVSNVASQSAEAVAAKLAGFGIDFPPDRVITSGSLISDYFTAHGLQGASCYALGSSGGLANVERTGAKILDPRDTTTADVFVITDLKFSGEFLPTVEAFLNRVVDEVRAGRSPHLLLANPDPSYPVAGHRIGIAPGSIATALEQCLAFECPTEPKPTFVRLGKPHAPIFEKACALAGTKNVVMIGDHIDTDILGAANFGISSALLVPPSVDAAAKLRGAHPSPTYLLRDLEIV